MDRLLQEFCLWTLTVTQHDYGIVSILPEMSPTKALDGCRVIDLTRLLPGPAATRVFANCGAEVIKVEEPGTGDPTRVLPISTLFDRVNRGKKSVVLNL